MQSLGPIEQMVDAQDILLFPFPTFADVHPSIIDKEGKTFLKTPFLFICPVNSQDQGRTKHYTLTEML